MTLLQNHIPSPTHAIHTLQKSLQPFEVHVGLCKCWVLPFMMSPLVTCQILQPYANSIAQHSYQRTPIDGWIVIEDKLGPPKRLHRTFALFFGNFYNWSACSERSSYICQLLAAIQCSKQIAWTLANRHYIIKMAKHAMHMHVFTSSTIYISIGSSLLRYSIAGLAFYRQTISYLHTAID